MLTLAVPVLFIVAVAVWRGETFAAESEATDGLFTSPMAANAAFTFLALAAFVATVLAARSYLRRKPLRDVRKKRARLRKLRDEQQAIMDLAERMQVQAQISLAHLREHEEHVAAEIEAWREARKKRFRHRASQREVKHRRKRIRSGTLPPDAVGPVSTASRPQGPLPPVEQE
jgi:septal ring factor EnvC (AmiA/AmiB activator)